MCETVDLADSRGAASLANVGAGRPDEKSLWLLPSGSDQVGDDAARPTPGRPYGEGSTIWQAPAWMLRSARNDGRKHLVIARSAATKQSRPEGPPKRAAKEKGGNLTAPPFPIRCEGTRTYFGASTISI
jgi:hypothetical protein